MTKLQELCNDKYPCEEITSVKDFQNKVRKVIKNWDIKGNIQPWFRGSNNYNYEPIPKVFRNEFNFKDDDEFWLATLFRNKAKTLGEVPEYGRIDKRLFLMQHFGLPTRLLDWTEGSLIALFFAVKDVIDKKAKKITNVYEFKDKINEESHPAVWMIHPIELNKMTKYIKVYKGEKISFYDKPNRLLIKEDGFLALNDVMSNPVKLKAVKRLNHFPNTWVPGKLGIVNFQYTFAVRETRNKKPTATKYPIAILPTHVHLKMTAQKSVFTIHGMVEDDFETLFKSEDFINKETFLRKYIINNKNAKKILDDLKMMGITYSTIFPDFEGLSSELIDQFRETIMK